jgi:hypothetical protein
MVLDGNGRVSNGSGLQRRSAHALMRVPFQHMASLTAVELGADTCALARTNVRNGEVELLAAETLDPGAFPAIDAFTAAVRDARKTLKLPRRCQAVVWGLPDGTTRNHSAVKHLVAPLVGAGFRVVRVISPCNALAALARLKTPRGEGATCWLALNRRGVAMIVVRPGQQLYSHSFAWNSNVGSSGSQARLLQRYSLVAYLAPEIRRAMNAAREKGTSVEAIVTCGNLPEIRSLTMPLIEELDVEVESLDTFEGLIVKPEAIDRLSDIAASLRIACAGAVARPTRRRDASKRTTSLLRSIVRIGAAVAVLLGTGLLGWSWWARQSAPRPAAKPVTIANATPKQPPILPQPTPAQKPLTAPVPPPPKADVTAKAPTHTPPPTPAPSTTKPQPPPVSEARKPEESKPPVASAVMQPTGSNPSVVREIRTPAVSKSLDTPTRPADTPDAATVRHPATAGPMPEPLKDPVPRVTSILVSRDRRMATVDEGRIISVGDVLGSRAVVAIDERAVVLREPSGLQIRVGLGGKVLGMERSDR